MSRAYLRLFEIRRLLPLGLLSALAALAAPAAAAPVAAAPPEVLKVEPPGWWAEHSIRPVRVLISGRGLEGARVQARAGVRTGEARASARGTYLFVDVHLDPGLRPGPAPLEVATAGGKALAPFEVLAPLPRDGRFQGFSPDDVIYLLMPDRFSNGDPSNDDPPHSKGLLDRTKGRYYHGGDLQGVIQRLPYLKDLGVTALWLNPVYDNADRLNEREKYDGLAITDYHGYGAVDFYAVDEHLGDVAKLRELVDEAHRAGIKVIQDQVTNHTGPYHPWVKDPPTETWLHGSEASHLANAWQVWTIPDPHATPELRKATLDGWFIDILPDLNQDDPEVERYLIQNTLWWIGVTGIDGIRMDTLPYVPRSFWSRWMAAIRREHPSLRVLGETWDGDPAVVSFFQGGAARHDGIDTGIDALFDFPLFYRVRGCFAEGKPLRDLASCLAMDRLYPDPDLLVTFLGLHDVPRFLNEKGASAARLQLAFTFLMTARGIPLVYYGDEIGLRGGGDPDNRRDFPGGWPGDPRSAFEAAGRTAEEEEILGHLRKLARLRAALEPLRRGSTVNLYAGESLYAFARATEGEAAVVLLSSGERPREADIPLGPLRLAAGAALEDRLGAAPPARVEAGRLRASVPAVGGAVYAARRER
ncbi:MAG: cyclomaltodextrinase N-terminal domain-containing protein [Planctomycetes bacterium]|nr:cyclomaltodextrinase N-terminal domain-containing protein [Planctomycetota bacterium]